VENGKPVLLERCSVALKRAIATEAIFSPQENHKHGTPVLFAGFYF
jgi:hypothetical protein